VHARGQVVHADVPDSFVSSRGEILSTDVALSRSLGRALPDDIVVRTVSVPAPGFDARFSAIWRRYVYRLWDDPASIDPLTRSYIAVTTHKLDVDAMSEAAATLLGLHDFAAFCKPREGATTVRTLLDLTPVRMPSGCIEVTVRADAFCHSMVRSLTGGLVAVGQGRKDASWLAEMLTLRHRANDITVMPAHGLTLEEVAYPPDAEFAERAEAARNRRDCACCDHAPTHNALAESDTPAGQEDPL
jgi:tRNA pseudouridine38-40 synthase